MEHVTITVRAKSVTLAQTVEALDLEQFATRLSSAESLYITIETQKEQL